MPFDAPIHQDDPEPEVRNVRLAMVWLFAAAAGSWAAIVAAAGMLVWALRQ